MISSVLFLPEQWLVGVSCWSDYVVFSFVLYCRLNSAQFAWISCDGYTQMHAYIHTLLTTQSISLNACSVICLTLSGSLSSE